MTQLARSARLAKAYLADHKTVAATLIARFVDNGRKFERRPGTVSPETFARLSGINKITIKKYLRAWDSMAQAGLVPPRDHLNDAYEISLPRHGEWVKHYRKTNFPLLPTHNSPALVR